jgi:hypothetical protein
MGHNASGAWIQAGSTFTGIGDTVAIGHVLYDSGFPIVPMDNLWVPAREDPTRLTVVLIGDIHIIGEIDLTPATETNFRRIGMAETPKRTAFELDTEEESFDLELSKLSRYTKWVYQRRSPKIASQGGPSGWYGGLHDGRPSCWKPMVDIGCRSLWQTC